MVQNGFLVHPPTLRKSGAAARTVGGGVAASAGGLKGAIPAAISAHPGWLSSGAQQQCLTAWEQRLPALATEVQQIGTGLQQSADHYERADQRGAEALRRLAEQLNGTGH